MESFYDSLKWHSYLKVRRVTIYAGLVVKNAVARLKGVFLRIALSGFVINIIL